jgi:hypothetical protein
LDVGIPALPTYDGCSPVLQLKLFPDYGDVYNGKNPIVDSLAVAGEWSIAAK